MRLTVLSPVVLVIVIGAGALVLLGQGIAAAAGVGAGAGAAAGLNALQQALGSGARQHLRSRRHHLRLHLRRKGDAEGGEMSGGKEQLSVIQEKLEIILRMWHELQRGEAGERGEMEEVWSGGILYLKKKKSYYKCTSSGNALPTENVFCHLNELN